MHIRVAIPELVDDRLDLTVGLDPEEEETYRITDILQPAEAPLSFGLRVVELEATIVVHDAGQPAKETHVSCSAW